MARRKFNASKLNTKLMIDIVGASLIVQQVPALLQQWFNLDQTVSKIGAVGVGYVAGSMLKHPDLSNAAIALFAVDMLMPMIGGILPVAPVQQISQVPAGLPIGKVTKKVDTKAALTDYISLNDYIPAPFKQTNFDYRNSY